LIRIFPRIFLLTLFSLGIKQSKTSYTSNAITQELIEGHTNRTSEARKEWAMKSKTFPKEEQGWRWPL